MKELTELKDDIVDYINRNKDYEFLTDLHLYMERTKRMQNLNYIALDISNELKCSDSIAEFIANHHEEIYNIILKYSK